MRHAWEHIRPGQGVNWADDKILTFNYDIQILQDAVASAITLDHGLLSMHNFCFAKNAKWRDRSHWKKSLNLSKMVMMIPSSFTLLLFVVEYSTLALPVQSSRAFSTGHD